MPSASRFFTAAALGSSPSDANAQRSSPAGVSRARLERLILGACKHSLQSCGAVHGAGVRGTGPIAQQRPQASPKSSRFDPEMLELGVQFLLRGAIGYVLSLTEARQCNQQVGRRNLWPTCVGSLVRRKVDNHVQDSLFLDGHVLLLEPRGITPKRAKYRKSPVDATAAGRRLQRLVGIVLDLYAKARAAYRHARSCFVAAESMARRPTLFEVTRRRS